MTTQNPAIPAQAATPGSAPAVVTPAPAATPAPTGNQGKQSAGQVTIDLKEYRDLQRAKARTLSFDKRATFTRSKNNQSTNGDPAATNDDPRLVDAEARAATAERTALALQVKTGVSDILAKPEFKNLPLSTRALILSNPAMLSDADNVEEALLDIEDRVRELAAQADDAPAPSAQPAVTPSKGDEPAGHETPPAPGTAPAPATGIELEDVSKLPPEQRSRGVLRNVMKKKQGVMG